MIKKITSNEYNNLKELVKKVFDASVAKDYDDNGKEEFYKFVNDNEKLEALDIWGYYWCEWNP